MVSATNAAGNSTKITFITNTHSSASSKLTLLAQSLRKNESPSEQDLNALGLKSLSSEEQALWKNCHRILALFSEPYYDSNKGIIDNYIEQRQGQQKEVGSGSNFRGLVKALGEDIYSFKYQGEANQPYVTGLCTIQCSLEDFENYIDGTGTVESLKEAILYNFIAYNQEYEEALLITLVKEYFVDQFATQKEEISKAENERLSWELENSEDEDEAIPDSISGMLQMYFKPVFKEALRSIKAMLYSVVTFPFRAIETVLNYIVNQLKAIPGYFTPLAPEEVIERLR